LEEPHVNFVRDKPMTKTIGVPPEIEAGLLAQAKTEGLPLPIYVQRLLREQFPTSEAALLTPTERAAAWRKSVTGFAIHRPFRIKR
jgi:hypothetical protein